ncbi:MAG: ankyrin repeat domain-containing protein [Wolbachia endosymbiont of Tyrophagus putrescentiae]|nr:ankyrin repeat domain-containing protein [Wolbachia endosymbiont of Tyrophagus putrescentiae]
MIGDQKSGSFSSTDSGYDSDTNLETSKSKNHNYLVAFLRGNKLPDGRDNESALSGRTMALDLPRMGDDLFVNGKKLNTIYTSEELEINTENSNLREILVEKWKKIFEKSGSQVPTSAILEELTTSCNQAGWVSCFHLLLFGMFHSHELIFGMFHSHELILCKNERETKITLKDPKILEVTHIFDIPVSKEGKSLVCQLHCEVTFTISSDDQNMNVKYENIKTSIEIPEELKKYKTRDGGRLADDLKEYFDYPLHVAARYGDVNVIKSLLESEVNVNETIITEEGRDTKVTPLYEAANSNYIEVAELLIGRDADVNRCTAYGSPLTIAISKGNGEMSKLFLSSGADPWVENDFHVNALHLAAYHGHYKIACDLLSKIDNGSKKKYIESQSDDGDTPLRFIAGLGKINEGHKKLIELLIKSGADPYSRANGESKNPSFNRKSAIEMAKGKGNQEFIRCIKSLQMIEAVKCNDLEKVNKLIKGGADPQFRNINGETALHYAAYYINPNMISTLIEAVPKRKRKSYVNTQDQKGDTPLHCLACYIPTEGEFEKYANAIRMLLQNGADLYDLCNHENEFALNTALNHNNLKFADCIGSFEQEQKYERNKLIKTTCLSVAGTILLGVALSAPLFVPLLTANTIILPTFVACCALVGIACICCAISTKYFNKSPDTLLQNQLLDAKYNNNQAPS